MQPNQEEGQPAGPQNINAEALAATIYQGLIEKFQIPGLPEKLAKKAIASQIKEFLAPKQKKAFKDKWEVDKVRRPKIANAQDLKDAFAVDIPTETKLRLEECKRNLDEVADLLHENHREFVDDVNDVGMELMLAENELQGEITDVPCEKALLLLDQIQQMQSAVHDVDDK